VWEPKDGIRVELFEPVLQPLLDAGKERIRGLLP
jgi:hypothetical protein